MRDGMFTARFGSMLLAFGGYTARVTLGRENFSAAEGPRAVGASGAVERPDSRFAHRALNV